MYDVFSTIAVHGHRLLLGIICDWHMYICDLCYRYVCNRCVLVFVFHLPWFY